ncbi:MAG: DUF748 domain-containing protein, partial [Thalassolituus sp.]
MKVKPESNKQQGKANKKYPKKARRINNKWARGLLITSGIIVALYLVLFFALPFFALRYVESWYADQGENRSLLIKGWTLSPLTGEVQLRDVIANYPTGDTTTEVGADFVGINVNLAALFSKTIHIQSVGVDGLVFRGAQSKEGLSIAGVAIPVSDDSEESTQEEDSSEASESGPLPEGWTLQVDDIALINNRVRWEQSGLSVAVRLSEFSTGMFKSGTEASTPLALDVTLESLTFDTESTPIVLKQPVTLTLAGDMKSLLTQPNITGDIKLSALDITVPGLQSLALNALEINDASFAMNSEGLSAGLTQLVLKQVMAAIDEQQNAKLEALIVNNVSWSGGLNEARVGDITLQGTHAELESVQNAGLKELLLAGLTWRGNDDEVSFKQITLSELSAEMPDIEGATLNSFAASDITVNQLSTEPTATIGSAGLNTLTAKHRTAGDLSLSSIIANTIKASAANQSVADITLEALTVMPPSGDQPLVSLDHYEVMDINATPESFRSGLHRFYGLVANATRLKNGAIAGVPEAEMPEAEVADPTDTPNTQSEETQSATESDNASSPFAVEIAGVEMIQADSEARADTTDTKQAKVTPSSFHWVDQAMTPNVSTNVSVVELRTGKIDTAALDKGVELHMVLALDTYNRVRVDGVMGMKGEYPEGKIDLNIEQLNLVEFNPYLVEAMGYRLKKGMLQVTSDISITDGQLGGEMLIVLQNSKFEPADEETIKSLSKQISMPVETALSVLKDDNNNIRIEVPLSGDISQPDVGINDVINQISKKALKTATLYYLKQSLVPYGQLLSIASFASDQIFAIRLNDLEYQPQQLDLTEEHKAYLDTVGKMMIKKAELELQVCPVAGELELKEWGENWAIEVAKRAASVKAYLAELKDNKDRSL